MQSVNLMPPDYARMVRAKRRLMVTAAVVFAAVLAMFGLAGLVGKWAGRSVQLNAIIAGEVRDLGSARSELATHARELRGLAEKLAVVQTLNRNRCWASYLAHIAKAANNEIVLTRASIVSVRDAADDSGLPRRDGPAAAAKARPLPTPNEDPNRRAEPRSTEPQAEQNQAKPDKLALLLKGYALSNTDITRFIAALSSCQAFERVTFKNSEMTEINAKQLSRFELECPIRYGQPGGPETAAPAGPQHAGTPLKTADRGPGGVR